MRLTPQALFGPVPLTGPVPSQVKISPDGTYASYLRPADDNRERLELWLVELSSGATRQLLAEVDEPTATAMTAQEKAERERRRQFAHGITTYAWHPTRSEILFPANGAAFVLDVADQTVRPITPPNTRQSGIQYSPQGNFVSYVRDGNLYCTNIIHGDETQLTQDGAGTVTNGLPEFIAQEEMGRFVGHWWSPDESIIAFTRVDTAPVALSNRTEFGANGMEVIAQRYPRAGAANAEVRLGVVDRLNNEVRWLEWQLADDDYLARVQFAPGALYVQAQSRDQKRLALRGLYYGQWREIVTETDAKWTNLGERLTVLKDGRLLWTSERSGTPQAHVYNRDGNSAPLNAGITRINHILGATNKHVWVSGHGDAPTEQHLYRVALDDGYCQQLTPRGAAWHEGAVHAERGVAVAIRSDPMTPCVLQVLDESSCRDVLKVAIDAHHPYFPFLEAHCKPEVGELRPGLHYRITKPIRWEANRRYPVIVHVYGGPGVQRVREDFAPLTLQLFAQAGFGVFELDNRGSANRDRDFEQAIHGCLGHVEVEDQLKGVQMLRELAWVDPHRIGIYGHSYGGYMVLKCLAKGIGFAAGIAVAPVTDWRLYDTHYTERYLGKPQENPAGYAKSAALADAAGINVPLLLMHGMADDNVLFDHSLKLVKVLQDAGVPFEMMAYPGSRHALHERSVAIHRFDAALAFFRRTLQASRAGAAELGS